MEHPGICPDLGSTKRQVPDASRSKIPRPIFVSVGAATALAGSYLFIACVGGFLCHICHSSCASRSTYFVGAISARNGHHPTFHRNLLVGAMGLHFAIGIDRIPTGRPRGHPCLWLLLRRCVPSFTLHRLRKFLGPSDMFRGILVVSFMGGAPLQ